MLAEIVSMLQADLVSTVANRPSHSLKRRSFGQSAHSPRYHLPVVVGLDLHNFMARFQADDFFAGVEVAYRRAI